MRLTLAIVFAALLAAPVMAQDYKTALDIPNGQTLVSLSASERVEVEQDLLVATLRFEAENKDPKALQNEINDVMAAALKQAKAVKDVQVSTQQYYVYPYDYDPNPKPVERGQLPGKLARAWRGQQGIELKSHDADTLLTLTGDLQALGLSMSNLSYTVSPELLESTRDSLLESALKKVKAKAERTAEALGKSKADLLEINVDIGGYYPQPMMARMEMAADSGMAKMSAPVATPGQSEVTLTVTARALLKP